MKYPVTVCKPGENNNAQHAQVDDGGGFGLQDENELEKQYRLECVRRLKLRWVGGEPPVQT